LFTAVEGRPPYDKGEPLPTLTAVITGDHAPFVAAGPLAPVLEALLVKDPKRRYDAAAARAGLDRVLASEATTQTTTPRPPTGDSRGSSRTTALSLGAVADEVAHEESAAPVVDPYPVEPAPAYAVPRPTRAQPAARRSRTPLVLGTLALALVVGLGLLLSSALKGGSNGSPSATGSDPSSTPSSSTAGKSGSTGSSGAGSTAGVPAGWQTHSSSGWTVAVPASYSASTYNGFPQYKDASTGRTLRVSTTGAGGGKADAVKDRRDQASFFAKKHAAYHEISIASASYRGYEAADWEFTYDEGGTTLHALSRVFVVDGKGYSLFFQTRGSDSWSAARAEFDQIAGAFQP
jgi:hypothetical protein